MFCVTKYYYTFIQPLNAINSYMPLIKNMHLLEDISDGEKAKLEHAALEHNRHNSTTFKIIEVKSKTVTIQVAQRKNAAGAYHNQKRLVEIVHETYDRFFKDKKIHVHAIPYDESPAVNVNAEWIRKQMLLYGIKLKVIAQETGLDYPNLSTYMKGEKPISQAMKALFYFYFLSKKKA